MDTSIPVMMMNGIAESGKDVSKGYVTAKT